MENRKLTVCIIGTFFCLFVSDAYAVTDWGITGVHDTAKVQNIVQLTTDEVVSGGSFIYSLNGDQGQYNGLKTVLEPWNKDGEWVTFTAENYQGSDNTQYLEVCKIATSGNGFAMLTNNTSADSNASFSNDGKIIYESYQAWNNKTVRIMDADGSNNENISADALGTNERGPVVSPDGTTVAYRKDDGLLYVNSGPNTEIRVSGTYDTTNDLTVTDGQYSWSPDSEWFVYSASDTTANQIYVSSKDGVAHRKLAGETGAINQLWPAWSPDGSKIAFLRQDGTNYELRIVNADTGTETKTLDSYSSTTSPGWVQIDGPFSWSPNSKWLAYHKKYSDTTSYQAIFIVNIQDASPSPSQLTTGYYDYNPSWGPHGSQILFQSGYQELSREDDCNPSCTDRGDILIMNLIGDYGSSVPVPTASFPWHMFLPAIEINAK